MIVIEDIKKQLAEAIKQSGLTQKALAQKLGTTQQAISRYYTGERVPSLDTLANLCVILDLDANEILCIR